MTLVESIVNENKEFFENKKVLEFACGEASLGLEISQVAKQVLATDIEDFRTSKIVDLPDNFDLKVIDARKIHTLKFMPDTLICFNGISHMENVLDEVIDSVTKHLSKDVSVLFFNSWKMDKNVANEKLLPLLDQRNDIIYKIDNHKKYQSITIKANSKEK